MAALAPAFRPFSTRVTVLCVVLAMIGAASMVYYHLGLFVPRVLELRAARGLGNGYSFGDDFYPIWLTVRLAQGGRRDLYGPEVTRKIQSGLFGRPLDASNPTDPPVEYRSFAYPAFTDLLLWPAGFVEFPTLRCVLAVLLPLLTIASIRLWMLALRIPVQPPWFSVFALLALCSYPMLEAFFAAQPGLIVGFLQASAAASLRRDRLFLAGVLMGLTLIKPQMTLLAIAYLLIWSVSLKRRAPFWAGFSAIMLLLMAASLWVWPRWIGQWIQIVLGYHRYATPSLVGMLLGYRLGGYVGPIALLVLLGTCAVLGWRKRYAASDFPEFWLTFSLLLAVTSITILPGQAIYDHVILFPGILLLVHHWRNLFSGNKPRRLLLAVGGIVLFWPWLAACALIVMRPLLTTAQFYSTGIFALPIRTAGSFPFVLLALLTYFRRVIYVADQSPAIHPAGSAVPSHSSS